VWINELNKHFPGALFGDYKQSGIGREECMEEMLAYRQEKTIHVRLRPGSSRSDPRGHISTGATNTPASRGVDRHRGMRRRCGCAPESRESPR
jgi:hypothetical protein